MAVKVGGEGEEGGPVYQVEGRTLHSGEQVPVRGLVQVLSGSLSLLASSPSSLEWYPHRK